MSLYLPVRKSQHVAVAICPRCKFKYHYDDFVRDPDTGLRVCRFGCADQPDPYRNTSRRVEDVSLPDPKPDEDLV